MSIFNIKLKTKNGNDVKRKETFTVYFRIRFKKGLTTKAEYTYRIMYSKGIEDPRVVLSLKKSVEVKSVEDLTLKVLLNLCHIIAKISKKENIDPDFILFISPDFGNKNNAWRFLISVFKRPQHDPKKPSFGTNWIQEYNLDYEQNWDRDRCSKFKINKEELDMLKTFADSNPNTKFMTIDPYRDEVKYAKSIVMCKTLQDRIDRNLQITMLQDSDSETVVK